MTIRTAFFSLLALTLALPAMANHELGARINDLIAASETAEYDWTILIENEDGSIRYYERNPHLPLTPASNTKIFTSAVAYELIGPDHEFKSEIFHTGSVSDGTLTGDLNLLVHFDLTWNSRTLDNVREPLDLMAAAVKEHGISTITGDVTVHGVSLYDRGQFDNVRTTAVATLNAQTAEAFVEALEEAGVTVEGDAKGERGFSPPGTLIHTHLSGSVNTRWGIPGDMTAACYTINRISHNPTAEILLRMIAHHASGGESILLADGGTAAIAHMASVGINTTGMAFNDGSGLSHANRFTAEQTVDILRFMSTKYPTWDATLAIGCRSGTISSRYCGEDTAGRVLGKTGSLSVSIALSGLVDNRHNGERYYFSFLANRPRINQNPTRDVIESCVRLLAEDVMLGTPTFASVDHTSDGVEVTWHNPGAQELFLLQTSEDGVNFDEGVVVPARYIIESRHDLQAVKNPGDVQFIGDFDPSSETSSATGTTPGAGSLFARPAPTRGDRARFTPSIASGEYEVFVTSFNFASANAPGITVRIRDAVGSRQTTFDMTQENTGGRWASLGTMRITHGAGHYIEFDNTTQTNPDANARMNPAAVKFKPVNATEGLVRYIDEPVAEGGSRSYRVAGIGRDGAVSAFSPVYQVTRP